MIAAAGAATIHATAKSAPELALIAAVIHKALTDAKGGDTDAIEWLGSADCLWYAGRLEMDGVEATDIQARLIEQAGYQVDAPVPGDD